MGAVVSRLQASPAMALQRQRLDGVLAGQVVQRKFGGVLEGLTMDQLREILPSYGIVDAQDVATIAQKFDALSTHPLPIMSVPQLVQRALGRTKAQTNALGQQVKQSLSDRAGEGVTEDAETVTLYRGDSRSPDEIRKAGGFFGRDLAPITIEHARQVMKSWQASSATQKLDRAQAWKAQTKGKTDIVPYVATGTASQKGGNDYKIEVPLSFRASQGDAEFTPKLGCDVWPLESATIMALRLHGGEVIFLTGVPAKFIQF
jgi:hypothetical protein